MKDPDNRTPHPSVKARRYDTAVGERLTDATIVKYALAGRYGTEIQRRAQELKKKKKKTKGKHVRTKDIFNLIDELLNDLL